MRAVSLDADRPRRAPPLEPRRPALGAGRADAAGRGLPRRRLPARAAGARAPRGRRRRREERGDRGGVDRGQGDARPEHAADGRALPGVRLPLARRLHHARPLGGRARDRPVRDPPALVPRALLPDAEHRRPQRPSGRAARRGGSTACAATGSSTRNVWTGGNELDLVVAARQAARVRRGEGEGRSGAGATRSRWSTEEKQRRLRRAAEAWLAAHPEARGLEARFDVVAVRERPARARGRQRSSASVELRAAVASTQDALYRRIDLDLSWSECDLPERERTKHVNRLHPYLGKFIPQLVEALLSRHLAGGGRVLDPFAGSGTTLVQALETGYDATGADVAPFNCLLMRVKTREYNPFVLESELRDALARLDRFELARPKRPGLDVRPRLVRAAGGGGAALLPRPRRRLRARRRPEGRAGARGAIGAADDPLRPRLPAEAAEDAVLVPQAPARVPAGRRGSPLPAPVRARHARAGEGVRARACARARGGRAPRRRA